MSSAISELSQSSNITTSANGTVQHAPDRYGSMEEKARLLQQIPLTELTLRKILPDDVFVRLIESVETCVALSKEGKRCRIRLKKPIDELPNIIEGLVKWDIRRDWAQIYQKLRDAVEVSLCRNPHGRAAMVELQALNYRMITLYSEKAETQDAARIRISSLLLHWLQSLCKNSDLKIAQLRGILAQQAALQDSELNQETLLGAGDSSATIGPEIERIEYLQRFSPFQLQGLKGLPLQSAIRMMLEKPLAFNELDSKYLYVYWSPGNFGYIKIGATDDVSKRLQGWEDKCKHDVREHRQQTSGERIVVKHAHRVERLVHTELKEVRYEEIGCKGCGGRHIEWFQTGPENAASIIKKYSDWTATDPYQFHQSTSSWRLDMSRRDEIEELCKPLTFKTSKTESRSRRKVTRGKMSTQNSDSKLEVIGSVHVKNKVTEANTS